MNRTALALCCSFASWFALAAPIPKPKDAVVFYKPGWDKPIDLDKDCKFTFARDALSIEVPAKLHDLATDPKRSNAPRLLRPVSGDFTMEVRVSADFHATEKATDRNRYSQTAAGLILVANDKEGVSYRLDFGKAWYKGPGARPCLGQVHETARGRSGEWMVDGLTHWPLPKDARSAWLRIQREGIGVYPSISADGKKWARQPWFKSSLPDKLKVGLVATSTSDGKLKVTFDQFKLTTP